MTDINELLKKGRRAELEERVERLEHQIRTKITGISVALNEFLVESLAELKVEEAQVLMQDLVALMDEYRKALHQIEALGG